MGHCPSSAQGHPRSLRLHRGDPCDLGWRHPQEHPVCGSGRQGRRVPGPPDRSAGHAGPSGARGCPPRWSEGSVADAEAAWRGAFLAHGSLTEPGRSSALEVSCPGPEAALALVGAARRLGVSAKAREVRGIDRVVVRDGEAIGTLLTRMGARTPGWSGRSAGCGARSGPPPTGWRTSTTPTCVGPRERLVAAAARVERALEILGDTVPDHLSAAGQLRVAHRQASLEELGRLADPPMTRTPSPDVSVGCCRWPTAKAKQDGIPDTESAVTPDLLEDT